MNKLNDKWLLYPQILILVIVLVTRLVDHSKIIFTFPLDGINDMSSYMAQLHFLKVCGFHEFCPYWYNGFITFIATQPGWYFFTFPLYLLFNNIQLASYVSLILMYIISFFSIKSISKSENLNNKKMILFFLLFFANAIAIGNFIRMGRFVSIFGFATIFLLMAVIYHYKERKLDKNFLLFIPFYFILLISHFQEMVLAHFLILGFILIKKNKERLKIVLFILISWILALFWYYPFLKHFFSTTLFGDYEGLNYWWTKLNGINTLTNVLAVILPIALIILFYLYYKQNKNRRELLFYSPTLILALLFLVRLSAIIPILNNISIDPIILFLLIFAILLFFKIDFSEFKIEKPVYSILIIIIIFSSLISLFITPYFEGYREIEKDSLYLASKARNNLFVLSKDNLIFSNAYNSYIPIAYNISVISGWYPYLSNQEYLNKVTRLSSELSSNSCSDLVKELNIKSILTYDSYCQEFIKCNYELFEKRGRACLFYVN